HPVPMARAVSGLRLLPDSVLVGRDLATVVAGPSHFRIANGNCEEPGRTANRFAECLPARKSYPGRHSARQSLTATELAGTAAAPPRRTPPEPCPPRRRDRAQRAAASAGRAGPPGRA